MFFLWNDLHLQDKYGTMLKNCGEENTAVKKIICAQFKQETNRYTPGLSDENVYRERECFWGEEAVREHFIGTKVELGAFFDQLDACEECRLVPVMALNASPGPVTAQTVWDLVANRLLEAIDTQQRVDGVLLALHGAMVTEEMEDGEGELLLRLRQRLGPDVPIVATLDLHANVTERMMENATALISCDYYPHTDFYETGLRAARILWQAVTGAAKPVMAWKKLPMLFPFVITDMGPIVPLLKKAQALRENGTLMSASICHGFFHSDIYEMGAAVLTVADGDGALAQKCADELAESIWAVRAELMREFHSPKEAVKLAMEARTGPVVLADVADNPGSGATMDSVVLLRQLLDMGATDVAFAAICDPQVVQQAKQAGIGAAMYVELGGKQAPEITGGPLRCTVVVEKLTDGRFRNQGPVFSGVLVNFGECALLRIGGIQVIVCTNHAQPCDLGIYYHCGINPAEKKILAVKSAVHFRAHYKTIAKQIIDVETPALGCMRPQMLPLAHCRRPIYPLDDLT